MLWERLYCPKIFTVAEVSCDSVSRGRQWEDSVDDSSPEELFIQHHPVAASPQQAGQSTKNSQTTITHSDKDEIKSFKKIKKGELPNPQNTQM